MKRSCSKLTALIFRKADFGLFKDLTDKVLGDRALEGQVAQECWLICKDHLLQAQEQCILTTRRSGKNARSPPDMAKELLSKLREKKEGTSRRRKYDRWPRRRKGKLYGKLGIRLGKLRPG